MRKTEIIKELSNMVNDINIGEIQAHDTEASLNNWIRSWNVRMKLLLRYLEDKDGDWISTEERLPDYGTFVWATCEAEGRNNWVIDACYLPIPKDRNVRGYSDWGNIPILNNGKAKVIAWMEQDTPEPYERSE